MRVKSDLRVVHNLMNLTLVCCGYEDLKNKFCFACLVLYFEYILQVNKIKISVAEK